LAWGERFSEEELETRRKLNPSVYAQNYLLQLEDDWMSSLEFDRALEAIIDLHPQDYLGEQPYRVYVGIDPAFTRKSTSSWSVIFVLAVTDSGLNIPLEIKRGKWSHDILCENIKDVYLRHHPSNMVIENNAAQSLLLTLLRTKFPDISFPLTGYFTGGQKHDLGDGLPAISLGFREGKWIIPIRNWEQHLYQSETHRSQCGFCAWIYEMTEYPTNTQDTLMAMWMAKKGAESTKSFASMRGRTSSPIRVIRERVSA